jgi:hypothetical protein
MRMPINPRSLAAGLWLAFVFGFTLEVAARLEDWHRYDAPLLGSYDFDRLFRLTDQGVRGVPHARYMRWKLNALGLHGPELRPDEGQTRIVVYGASESFGIYEDEGREFPRALESDLNSASSAARFEVVNAGIPGMRVGSGTLLLRELGTQLHPRVAVIYATPTHYIGVRRPYCGRPPGFAAPESDGGTRLRIVDKLRETVKRVLPPEVMTEARKASIAWQARHSAVIDRAAAESIAAMEADLGCAVRAAREAGMTPILVTHANRFGPVARPGDDIWLTGWRNQYPEMQEGGFLDLENRANAITREVANAERVMLVDAAEALGGRSALFADHAHFNNDGAAAMGALLAPAVLAASGAR